MTNDKQIEAAFEKWENYQLYYGKQERRVYAKKGYKAGYKAAIAATNEQYKPLVEALEYCARNHHHLPTNAPNFAHEALANISEEKKRW